MRIKVIDATTGNVRGYVSAVRYAMGTFYTSPYKSNAMRFKDPEKLHYAIDFCARVSGGRYVFSYEY